MCKDSKEEMTKYAVDTENDSFERAAETMVKTGEVSDIDEARIRVESERTDS